MAEHAKLMSPSSSARRIACPGSYVLEASIPDKSSEASDDGTAMHWVAAECLTSGSDARAFVGRYIDVHDAGEPVRRVQFTEDFADLVQPYVDNVRARRDATGALLLVERRVDFSRAVDMPAGSQFGTADTILFEPDAGALEVHDFKSGYKRVEAIGNTQLQLYAVGALAEVAVLGEVKTLRLVIHQPKVYHEPQEWAPTLDELAQFTETARRATHACKAAEYCMQGGGIEFAEKYLRPGDEQCTFCKAAGTCPALRGVTARVTTFDPHYNVATADDFDVIGEAESAAAAEDAQRVSHATAALPECTPEQLGRLLKVAPLVELWLKALRAEGDRRLLAGQAVPGFKVVAGKKGARKWADPEAAEAQLKTFRLKVEEMYDLQVISPTTAEKLTKGDNAVIGPRQWVKLQTLITQADGAPSVVPDTDKRPALQIKPPTEDFEVVDQAPAAVAEPALEDLA